MSHDINAIRSWKRSVEKTLAEAIQAVEADAGVIVDEIELIRRSVDFQARARLAAVQITIQISDGPASEKAENPDAPRPPGPPNPPPGYPKTRVG